MDSGCYNGSRIVIHIEKEIQYKRIIKVKRIWKGMEIQR